MPSTYAIYNYFNFKFMIFRVLVTILQNCVKAKELCRIEMMQRNKILVSSLKGPDYLSKKSSRFFLRKIFYREFIN